MSDITRLVSQLALLSSGGYTPAGDVNAYRRQVEDQLSANCMNAQVEYWLPLFLGQDSNLGSTQSYSASNVALIGGGPSPAQGILGLDASAMGGSAVGFVGLTFLVDFIQKNGKALQNQRKGPSMAPFVIRRVSSLLLEVAVIATTSTSLSFPAQLLNWTRKLSVLCAYLLHNNATDLSMAVQCFTELVHFALDAATMNAAPHDILSSLPFDFTGITVSSVGQLAADQSLATSLCVVSMTALHVLLKTAAEKKLSQKALKGLQLSIVGTALINGNWLQSLYSTTFPSGTFTGNCMSLAKVSATKLTARILKVILATTSYTSGPSSVGMFHSSRAQAVCGSRLDTATVSAFIVNGLGATLQNFAVNELPPLVRGAISGNITLADPLSVRSSYFILKAFHLVLTDSMDGAVGTWTSIFPPEVCATNIVSNIFAMLMVLPSPASCAAAPTVAFPPSSSCPSFDLFASFEKIFLLCASSVQHICSMDESAPYYATVLQTVFPCDISAVPLATSVLRQLLVEYLRDDNGVRERLGTAPGGSFQAQLLADWQREPERYFEELELQADGDTSEAAAEQLFSALIACRACLQPDSTLLFSSAAWQVVSEMLKFNEAGSEVAAAGADTTEHELAKLMAYRAIGLGHYSLAEGQDENYKAFFYNQLLPDAKNGANFPLVQRRAIWCIGMWCESATADMRRDVYATYFHLLSSGSSLNPVILLTTLNSLEHFANDLHFDASYLPDGFMQMLFGGLSQLFPIIRSPTVIQTLCGLVSVLAIRVGSMEGLGDVMFQMLAPTISQFCEEVTKEAATDNGDGDDAWKDEDNDDVGAMVGAVHIILETLTTAVNSNMTDQLKLGSHTSSQLMRLLKLLTDPFNRQGNSGYFLMLLEDEAWELWGALFRTSGSESLQFAQPGVLADIGRYFFSMSMLERDFEGKAVYYRSLMAYWLLVESAAASGQGQDCAQLLDGMRSTLQAFAVSSIETAMTTADDDLLLVSVEIGMLLTVLPSTTAISAPVFMACVGNYFFSNADSDLESNSSSPILLTLLTYTIPRCITAGTPAPSTLAERVSALADVTTNQFPLSRILYLVDICVTKGLLDFSTMPQDAATLRSTAESIEAQLRDSFEGAVNGVVIAESFNDDIRISQHTQRLEQLLLS